MSQALEQRFNIRHEDMQVRNGNIAWWHINSEYTDVVDEVMTTLAPEGPYAYTVFPGAMPEEGAIPQQKVLTTRDEIHACYENLHRFIAVREMRTVVEFRCDWYTFMYGMGEGLDKSSGAQIFTPTAVLFPTMGQPGITGELFWIRCRVGDLATNPSEGALASPLAILDLHDRFVELLRVGDVDGIVGAGDPNAQTSVRDYVDDTGTLVELHDAAGLRDYLQRFYARYAVEEIELVHRYISEWFVFAELRWVVRATAGADAGKRFVFRTAEVAEVGPDGLIAARIGHGTDQVTVQVQ